MQFTYNDNDRTSSLVMLAVVFTVLIGGGFGILGVMHSNSQSATDMTKATPAKSMPMQPASPPAMPAGRNG